jgi:NADH-quinone oxidoreductase subunit A
VHPSLLQYLPLVLGVLFAVALGAGMLILNALLGPKRTSAVKDQPFECGNESLGPARNKFNVRYYVVALVFLVFDVEVVFVLPWAVGYRGFIADQSFGLIALTEVLLFVAILAVGLLYVWKRGALDWGPGRREDSR